MSASTISRWQRLCWWATLPVGLGVAYGASAVTARARAFCDAAWEPPHRLVHLVELVLLAGAAVTAALLAAVVARRVTDGAPRAVRGSSQLVSVLLVLLLLAWWYVGLRATPDGYPGDSGLCAAGNVPPWWPAWLPS
ncbi:hypothetical protein [Streptomyces roseoviridis]|uniref:Uncharacterized protein n=1 Tax=Streptomyces roseoviridis TaxID=67361 RepID=A0ABV5QWQ7_9ACTN